MFDIRCYVVLIIMNDGDECTKDEVTNFMASQGLVYSGLDGHFDEWFEKHHINYGFECIGKELYIYHEGEW